jgi:hypothetical protein
MEAGNPSGQAVSLSENPVTCTWIMTIEADVVQGVDDSQNRSR